VSMLCPIGKLERESLLTFFLKNFIYLFFIGGSTFSIHFMVPKFPEV